MVQDFRKNKNVEIYFLNRGKTLNRDWERVVF